MAKYFYTLKSCDQNTHSDITNLCLDGLIPDVGESVYINSDPSKLYVIEFDGVDIGVCNQNLPPYIVSNQKCTQTPNVKCFEIENCDDGTIQNICLEGIAGVGITVEIDSLAGCWKINSEVTSSKNSGKVVKTYTDCTDCNNTVKEYYLIENCNDSNLSQEVEIIGGLASVGDVIQIADDKGCWLIKAQAQQGIKQVTLLGIYSTCTDCQNDKPRFYNLETCDGLQTNTVRLIGGNVTVGDVIRVEENSGCWTVIEEVQDAPNIFNYLSKYIDCDGCTTIQLDCREDGERTIAYANMVRLPKQEIPNKGFKECYYNNLVLAHQTDSETYKNDFTGFYYQRQTPNDSCDFILHELSTGDTYALNNNIYGDIKNFGDIAGNEDLTTYILQWRKVLTILGAGQYQIEKSITTAGISTSIISNTFTLEEFTTEKADKSIRIDANMDGKLVHLDTNFKNSGFKTSVRTKGYFGRRNPKYKQDNLVKRNYEVKQISMSQENEYQLQTGLIPECITKEIYDFILFGNDLFISDYNLNNHSYGYKIKPVELATNKGTKYFTTNRDANINLTFKDRIKNKRKINC